MKKINLLLAVTALAVIAFFPSCRFGCIRGTGNSITNTRKLGSFNKIHIDGGFKVIIKQDSSEQVAVTADENLQKYIHTVINGNTLRIYSRKNFCHSGQLVLKIGVRKLESIKGEGAVEVNSDGNLNTEDLRMDFSGASKITLDLNAKNVYTTGSGATEVHLTGQASSHRINLTGSGKLYGFDFIVGDYNIETTGASHVEVNVLKSLKVNTTGASSIKYKGNPSDIQNDKSGASSIEKVD